MKAHVVPARSKTLFRSLPFLLAAALGIAAPLAAAFELWVDAPSRVLPESVIDVRMQAFPANGENPAKELKKYIYVVEAAFDGEELEVDAFDDGMSFAASFFSPELSDELYTLRADLLRADRKRFEALARVERRLSRMIARWQNRIERLNARLADKEEKQSAKNQCKGAAAQCGKAGDARLTRRLERLERLTRKGVDSLTTIRDKFGALFEVVDSMDLPVSVMRPPVLHLPGPQRVIEGATLSFGVSASNPEGGLPIPSLSADLSGLPGDATFFPQYGLFVWITARGQAGEYRVPFSAWVWNFPVSGEVVITVVASAAPGAGTITTFAGDGSFGDGPDGGQAVDAPIGSPVGIAVDADNNVYFSDSLNNRVRRVDAATGVMTTVAGNGFYGYSGDGGAATSASLAGPLGLAFDISGNLYIADNGNLVVRRVDRDGTISTVAGDGMPGFTGDGLPATQSSLSWPRGVAVSEANVLYISDTFNARIRAVDLSSGIMTTVAGTGFPGFNGDIGAGTTLQLYDPSVIEWHNGALYVADTFNGRVRSLRDGLMVTVAGGGFGGDGGAATAAALSYPSGVSVDGDGNIYIVEALGNRVRKVSGGIISTLAGTGMADFAGDGGPAVQAALNFPLDVAVDAMGNAYVTDNGNLRVRVIGGGR